MSTIKEKLRILLILMISVVYTSEGAKIYGTVSDEEGNLLPFATIYVSETNFGATTNFDGYYEFNLLPGNYELIYQYMGYKSITKKITITDADLELFVLLEVQSYVLPSLVYTSGEDPAYNIMRQVISKSKYHLYQLSSYETNVYVKGTGRVKKVPFLLRKRMAKEGIDSTRVFTIESVTEIKYKMPNTYEENVISISSNTEENAPSPMPYIKASFYEPRIVEALSPLSPNAFMHYRFRYDGAFKDKGYTIFKIYVQPKIKGDQVFDGHLYIAEDLWCIHSLDFNSIFQGFRVNINQIYHPVKPIAWMPVTHKFNVEGSFMGFEVEFKYAAINNYNSTVLNDQLDHTYAINIVEKPDSVQRVNESLEPVIAGGDQQMTKKEMRKKMRELEKEALQENDKKEKEVVINRYRHIDSTAYDKDSAYWAAIRPIPLSSLEMKNYELKDSLIIETKKEQKKDSLRDERNKSFRIEHVLIGNDYKVGGKGTLIWHPLWNKLSFNSVEGWNIHAKLDYRIKLDSTRSLTFGTNVRYGFSSRWWNYKLFTQYRFKSHYQTGLFKITAGRYISQINESNPIPYWWNMITSLFFKNNYMKLYEKDFVRIDLEYPVLPSLFISFDSEYAYKKDLTNNTDFSFFNRDKEYTPNNPENILMPDTRFSPYNFFMTDLSLKYQPFLRYYIYNGRKQIIKGSSPEFEIRYKMGISWNIVDESNYNLLTGGVRYGKDFGVGNRYDISVTGGKQFLNGDTNFPEYIHFMGNETPLITGDLITSFRMLPYYYYSTNDYFIEGHLYYQFRKLLITQITLFRYAGIREDLFLNYMYANSISNYYEIGYALENIFRFLRFEVIGQFEGVNYSGIGFRVGISKNISLD